MTDRYKSRGFVVNRADRSESDRVFTIITDNFGRLEIVAKAIRKITSKLKSGIDFFSFSEIEFIQGKSYKTLTDAIFVKKFSNIILDPEKLKIANKITGVINDFVNGQEKDETLFFLINESFEKLNDMLLKRKNYNFIYYYFLWNFFSGQGYQPEVYRCVACHTKLNPCGIYFSNKGGGVICGNCVKTKKTEPTEMCQGINSDVVKILRLILKKNWQTLSKLKIESNSQKLLEEISNGYHSYLLSR
jgi:DNA repair protein RecO (recombination protein O)